MIYTELKGKKAAVIGGSGFLGSYVCMRLITQGCSVTSISRNLPEKEVVGVNYQRADITLNGSYEGHLQGVDIVFLVAAKAGYWGAYSRYHAVNYVGAENVLKACLDLGIQYLIYTSTPSVAYSAKDDVDGWDESVGYAQEFLSPYPKSKALAEKLILNQTSRELKTIALRPHIIWGLGDRHIVPRILTAAKQGKLRRLGKRDVKVDMTHVENAAEAHICAAKALLEKRDNTVGKAFFISDDQPVHIWEWINQLLLLLELKPVTSTVNISMARRVAHISELIHKSIPSLGEPRLSRFLVDQLTHNHYFNIEAAKRELGYVPKVNQAEALLKYAEHLKKGLH
ncbi:MAG: NAD-dependent epimerase/dehydratase family protein [Salibacteraceae bacterium]